MFGGLFSTTKKSCSSGGRKRHPGTKRYKGGRKRHAGTKKSCSSGGRKRHPGTKRRRGRGHYKGGRKSSNHRGGMCGCEKKKGGRKGMSRAFHKSVRALGKAYHAFGK